MFMVDIDSRCALNKIINIYNESYYFSASVTDY